MAPSKDLIEAIAEVWRIKALGHDDMLKIPAVARLNELCISDYGLHTAKGPGWALSSALQSLGVPCKLPPSQAKLALDVDEAAAKLHHALTAKTLRRRHMAPLDLLDDIPDLDFGNAKVRDLTKDQLAELFDAPRLKRYYPTLDLDAGRLASFRWLIVEEEVPVTDAPEARYIPILFQSMDRDFGEIEPHKSKYPPALEAALFFLLLPEWEEWVRHPEIERCGFQIPWVYTVDEDLFVRPTPPPSPDKLTWSAHYYINAYGDQVDYELPETMELDDPAMSELHSWNQRKRAIVENARQSALFETPIAHFFVHAFGSDGMDEFMAYLTAIDAALGLHSDHRGKKQKGAGKQPGATESMCLRVAGLLGDLKRGTDFHKLFDIRSTYVHGRKMGAVPSRDRILARSLARQVVTGLIDAAQAGPITSREDFLNVLLAKGQALAEP